MSFAENLFQRAWRWLRERADPSPDDSDRAVTLEELKPRLSRVAQALAGESLTLAPAEREGGWSGATLFLPARFAHLETRGANEAFYLFRVAFLVTQRALGLNWEAPGVATVEESRRRAAESASRVLEHLCEELPGAADLVERVVAAETLWQQRDTAPEEQIDFSWLWGRWIHPAHDPRTRCRSAQKEHEEADSEDDDITRLQAPPKEELTLVDKDEEAIADYTLAHHFEKVETVEAFSGQWRDLDGDDELEEQKEAVDAADLSHVMRADDPSHSVYEASFSPFATAPESADDDGVLGEGVRFVTYDEWDYEKRRYLRGHCRVFPTRAVESAPEYLEACEEMLAPTRRRLRRQLHRFFNVRQVIRRQPFGDTPDLDAVVDRFAEMNARRAVSEKVYLDRRKRRSDIALLLLLDVSLSTDGYTGGRRILDVEKQAVLLFGDLLKEAEVPFEVDAFSSRTRNHCDFTHVKRFDDPWRPDRVGALKPRGYTRIGPAIRHASARLLDQPARRRHILLLSDGKPNDYDRYEGRHGVEDVRQAIREGRRDGVRLFGLAVEAGARDYLPRMLGPHDHRILSDPAALPEALLGFLIDLLRR